MATISLEGTTEGAIKGWETRRGGAGPAEKETKGGSSGGSSTDDDIKADEEFAPIDHVATPPDSKDLGTTRPKVYKTKDLGEAVDRILAGDVITLESVGSVHTVLSKLAAMAEEAKAAGGEGKKFDLCKVNVAGSKHLFCGDAIKTKAHPNGIPRIAMPQVTGEPVPGSPAAKLARRQGSKSVDAAYEFVKDMQRQGIKVRREVLPASLLKATQVEMVGAQVAQMMSDPKYDPGEDPIFISNDSPPYVVDGHHRWAAVVARDAADGRLGQSRMNVRVIDAPIAEILKRAKAFGKKFGIKPKSGSPTKTLRMIFDGTLDAFLEPYKDRLRRLANGELVLDPPKPVSYRQKLAKSRGTAINLPDISDVKFPAMIGAMPDPATPKKKKRRSVKYKGVKLSRKPTYFEVEVLSLTEIPPRLDAAVAGMVAGIASLSETVQAMADYGAQEVHRELTRQGATITIAPPTVNVTGCVARLERDQQDEQISLRAQISRRLARTRITGDRRDRVVEHLLSRREPAATKWLASRAVNEAFALGRRTAIAAFRRPTRDPISLTYKDEEGKFISDIEAVNSGLLAIDAVIQTAVMDTNTCDECSEVDGEVMEFGSDQQEELHPPYIKCAGGDRCRCTQIAILSNGKEINVDEIDEDTLADDDEEDDF